MSQIDEIKYWAALFISVLYVYFSDCPSNCDVCSVSSGVLTCTTCKEGYSADANGVCKGEFWLTVGKIEDRFYAFGIVSTCT